MFTTLRQPVRLHSLITLLYQKPALSDAGQRPVPCFTSSKPENFNLSITKPLQVSSLLKPRKQPLVECNAYEADRSQPLDVNIKLPSVQSETAKRVKLGIYFATWWALNVVFNIYNKKVLNAFPYPWLTSTLALAAGSLMMLISWATRMVEAPKTDLEFWKILLPVSFFSLGHLIQNFDWFL